MKMPAGKKTLAMMLILAMVLSVMPLSASAQDKWGCVIKDKIFFRQKPSSSASYWERLTDGWVMEILGTQQAEGVTWYYVQGGTPSAPNKTYKGYIHGDYFRMLSDSEAAAWEKNRTQGMIAGGGVNGDTATVKTTGGTLTLRATQSTSAAALDLIPNKTVVQVLEKGSKWTTVQYNGKTGYVLTSYLVFPGTVSGGAADDTGSGNVPAGAVTGTATVKTTGGTLTLRAEQSTAADALAYIPNKTVLQIIERGSKWTTAVYNGKTGYVLTSYLVFDTQSGSGATPPSSGTQTGTAGSYVRTITSGVNLRSGPSTASSSVTSLPQNTVLAVVSYSDAWYYVSYGTRYGYISEGFVQLMSQSEVDAYLQTGATGGATGGTATGTATVRTTGGTLTLRSTQSTSASALAYIPNKTVLQVKEKGSKWSTVVYNGKTGYVLTSYLVFDSSAEPVVTAPPVSSYTTATVKTTGGTLTLRETESTSAKGLAYIPNKTVLTILKKGDKWCQTTYNGYTGYVLSSYLTFSSGGNAMSAYVYVTNNSVYIRASAAKNGRVVTKVNKGTVLPMWGTATQNDGYTWYPVVVNNTNAYIRGDCSYQMTLAQYNAFATGGATPDPNANKASKYVRSISTALNIRAAASTASEKIAQVGTDAVFPYSGKTTVAGVDWYKITYEGISCFVMAKYVKVLTNAEYQEYLGTLPTATPMPDPTPIPDLSRMSDMAYTVKDNILVRKSGTSSATSILKIYNGHTYMTLLGETNNADGYLWYKIKVGSTIGWIRGDLITIMTPEEKAAYLNGGSTGSTGSTGSDKYVQYTTLRLGSTGTPVRNLQTALANQGYLNKALISGNYLQSTKDAVIAFQKAKKLTADGIAGQQTQAALYGTPAYDTPKVDGKLYPVELVDWYKGDIQKVWAKGKVAVITDVKTGLSFNAKRWSGGYHADVEPLTAADTAVMCRIYGVKDAQEISDRNLYQRRPLWVTVGGRTFAASMYGVPHNYPDGDTLPNNAYNGQFCVHFVNSRVHRSGAVDKDHQDAIQYAYSHAPSKK